MTLAPARYAIRVRLRCEADTSRGRVCPVRFSWIGPDRVGPTREREALDEQAGIDRAVEIGWRFGESSIVCPRHAASVARDALEVEGPR